MKFSVMHNCIFGHYLVTPAWTYSHDNFELVWESLPSRILRPMLYVSLCIIYFKY